MSDVFVEPGLEPAEPVVEPEPAPEWTGPSQDEWSSVMGYIQSQQQQQAEWEAQQAQQQATQGLVLDPLEDDFQQRLEAYLDHREQQRFGPYAEYIEQQRLGEAEERAHDIIQDDVSRNGEFLLGEKAYSNIRAIANTYMEDEVNRHGFGPKAAEAALARAASDWREYEKELAQVAVDRHMNQLSSIAGAPREPGVSPVPAGQLQQGARSMDELIAKYGS